MSYTRLGLIWAEARGGVIGRAGSMPWHLPEDLGHFKRITMGSPVVMGRRTWESLPDRARPLPGRPNIVVTRNPEYVAAGAEVVSSVEAALVAAAELGGDIVWNIGGSELFHASMNSATELVVTRIEADIADGDTWAPKIGDEWQLDSRSELQQSVTGLEYRIERWLRRD